MSGEYELKAGERVDDLQRNGLCIIQNPDAFRFGMDALLLADFTRPRRRDRIADLGTGTGILPLIMSQNEPSASFEAIELQSDMADMAARSVAMNGLGDRISVRCMDLRAAHEALGRGSMDGVVCNPPYGKKNGTLKNETETVLISRHETDCTVDDIAHAASELLRDKGRLWLVFPAPRLLELCDALRHDALEPKRLRMVCAKADRAPYLVLVEAVKKAKPALLWLPPLIVYERDGSPTDELRRIYHEA